MNDPHPISPTSPITRAELKAAAASGFSAMFFLCGYEFLRSTSNTILKKAYGVEALPVAIALMPLGVVVAVAAYNWVLTRLGPRRTLVAFLLLSAAVLSGSYVGLQAGIKPIAVLLYVFRQVYVILIIEQLWSFVNSSLSTASEKRLTGPMIGIQTIGSVVGGLIVSRVAIVLGTKSTLLFAGAFCIPAAIIADWGYRTVGEPKRDHSTPRPTWEAFVEGLREFRRSPVLYVVLGLVISSQALSTIASLNFQTLLEVQIPDPDQQTAFSARAFSIMNMITLGFQFVIAPLLLRVVPLIVIHAALPAIHLLFAANAFVDPTVMTTAFAYFGFKVLDYSLYRTAKELYYVPLSYTARFRSKAVIDILGYRASKGATGFAITGMQKLMAVTGRTYAGIAMALAAIWFILVMPLRHYTAHAEQQPGKGPEPEPAT